jgi:hypothetical protein
MTAWRARTPRRWHIIPGYPLISIVIYAIAVWSILTLIAMVAMLLI